MCVSRVSVRVCSECVSVCVCHSSVVCSVYVWCVSVWCVYVCQCVCVCMCGV